MEPVSFFGGIFEPIENLFKFVLGGLYSLTETFGFGNYGLAIIILTVIIKVLLYPLTQKQLKSMKAMQELQPKLKKIQEKYKDNPQMLQQKMTQLYQNAGVNPLAGCLPLLIQMPILMAMYYALFSFDYGETVPSFLWIENLSHPDPFYILPLLSALTTNKNFYGSHAAFHRFHKFKFPCGTCFVLGDDECCANSSAVVDFKKGQAVC